jgi:hypothetical protein
LYEYSHASFQPIESHGAILLFTLHNSSATAAEAIL